MGAQDSDMSLPERPGLAFRMANSFQLGWVGAACRSFLLTFNRLEVHGWDKFQKLLDERDDVGARTRGLITVSNHTSVYVCISFYYHFSSRFTVPSFCHDLAESLTISSL